MKIRIFVYTFACLVAVPCIAADPECTPRSVGSFTEFLKADLDGTGQKKWQVTALLTGDPNEVDLQYAGKYQTGPMQFADCDCPNDHRDCDRTPGPQPYYHIHYQHDYPLVITVNMAPFNITEQMVQDFWDDEYEDYEREGGVDVTQNCHGYGLGYGTWIQGDSGPLRGIQSIVGKCYDTVYADYPEATIVTSTQFGGGLAWGHMIKIEDTALVSVPHGGFAEMVTETSEKYRDSPVYRYEGDANNLPTFKPELGARWVWVEGQQPQQQGPNSLGEYIGWKPK